MKLLLIFITHCLTVTQSEQEIYSFKSFDGVKIAYTDEGKGNPIILIHGFISSGSSWNGTVVKKALIEAGYRVIVPDLRGNGKSDKPQNPEAYANDAEIKDLKALANHLELTSYQAIGYSRGAIVLAKLLTQESKISKAVLGGMGLDFTNPNWDRRIMFADAFSGRTKLNDATKGAVEYAKSVGADLKVLGLLQDYQPVTSVAALNQIKIPILVIAGDQDHDNGSPQELKNELKQGQLSIISGDHNNASKGEVFAQEILKFFSH